MRLVVPAMLVVVLGGCSGYTIGGKHPPSVEQDVVRRSSVRLIKPLQQAAACIADNARATGNAADPLPLYGLETIGVTVKTRVTGDPIAVFSLMRSDTGTVATATAWPEMAGGGEALLRSLVQGC